MTQVLNTASMPDHRKLVYDLSSPPLQTLGSTHETTRVRFDDQHSRLRFLRHELDANTCLYTGLLPRELIPTAEEFESLWNEHPLESTKIRIAGCWTSIPRFQQAYEAPYTFSDQTSPAVPAPPIVRRYLVWIRAQLDDRLNGLLVNWYGPEHYIGPHSDAWNQLIPNSPIVTLSFGEPRLFRMSRGCGSERRSYDLTTAPQEFIIVIPWETNQLWKHSVPKSKKYHGRRISITARAFQIS